VAEFDAQLPAEVRQLLRSGDSFAAIERIHRTASPMEIAGRYRSLVSDLYWKAHDLPAVVLVGRAGILHCLGRSLAESSPLEPADALRSLAKGLAYDIGSFTWPGWEEPGINPTPEELAFGRDCARLNLRLAIELKKPPDRLSMAHWLLGAHALAAGDADEALGAFETARDVLPATDAASEAMALLNFGYITVARLRKGAAGAGKSFDQTISRLEARNDDDARQYIAQLKAARRLYSPS
jgi:hypothetical protein